MVLVVGIGLVYSTLGFAAHPLHVFLVFLLNVLHPDVVDAVKQGYLQSSEDLLSKPQLPGCKWSSVTSICHVQVFFSRIGKGICE